MKSIVQKLMLAAALTCLAGGVEPNAGAADRQEGRKSPAERLQRFRQNVRDALRQLNLSEEQKAALKEVFTAEREVIQELRQDDTLTPRQKFAKLRAIRAEILEAMEGILTPEQWALWQSLREEQREQVRRDLQG